MTAFDDLRALFRTEHAEPVPEQARAVCPEIVRQHSPGPSAVLCYGACLRKDDATTGVLDFYAVVDSYRASGQSRMLAAANALLPPNVFLLSVGSGEAEVHSKYAVISAEDFARGVTGRTLHSIVWARFCQPARIVWARDQTIRDAIASACAEAAVTMMRIALATGRGAGAGDYDAEDLWQHGFRATYTTELRTERPDTIRQLYEAAPARYTQVGALALRELAARGEIGLEQRDDGGLRFVVDPVWAGEVASRWRWRTPLAKAVYLLRLVKSALTFGDWLPYALWKLGRHTGVRLEPTPLQRKYPLVFGWPVLFKLLRSRSLR